MIKTKKKLGQHFLTDKNMLKKIAALADVCSDDIVLEIGAGTGNLTEFLIESAKFVYCIEIDRTLIDHLEERFAGVENIKIIQGDFLDLPDEFFYNIVGMQSAKCKVQSAKKNEVRSMKYEIQNTEHRTQNTDSVGSQQLGVDSNQSPNYQITKLSNHPQPLKIVSNIPYYIASQIIFKILELGKNDRDELSIVDCRLSIDKPTDGKNSSIVDSLSFIDSKLSTINYQPSTIFKSIYFLLQKDIADRIVAQPHTKDYGILSVICQYHTDCKILMKVPKTVFVPQPKVESCLIRMMPKCRTQNTDSVVSGQWSIDSWQLAIGTETQRHKDTKDKDSRIQGFKDSSESQGTSSEQLEISPEQSPNYQITKLSNHHQASVPLFAEDYFLFKRLVKAAFHHRRKKCINSLLLDISERLKGKIQIPPNYSGIIQTHVACKQSLQSSKICFDATRPYTYDSRGYAFSTPLLKSDVYEKIFTKVFEITKIDKNARAEDISVEDYVKLSNVFAETIKL